MATWFSHWEILPNGNVILLEMDHGKLVRRFGSINIKGQNLDLKRSSRVPNENWEKGPLYGYLTEKRRIGPGHLFCRWAASPRPCRTAFSIHSIAHIRKDRSRAQKVD
jgi:hypothetical protein